MAYARLVLFSSVLGKNLPDLSLGLIPRTCIQFKIFLIGGFALFCYILTYRNAGVAPTVRYTNPVFTSNNQSIGQTFGIVRNNAGTAHFAGNRISSSTFTASVWLTGDPLPSFTPADIISKINTTAPSLSVGFSLNVIK